MTDSPHPWLQAVGHWLISGPMGHFVVFFLVFHDQHHKYFRRNFGGYTTIWDFLCGTVRPKYLADFDQIKARLRPRERTGMALSQDSYHGGPIVRNVNQSDAGSIATRALESDEDEGLIALMRMQGWLDAAK
jgi:hypothetical protein